MSRNMKEFLIGFGLGTLIFGCVVIIVLTM